MEEETLKNFEESAPTVSDGALAVIRRELESYRGKYHDLLSETKRLEQELAAARKSAEQANRDKSEFLANMSHELRTPLNAITGLTRMLAEMNPDREAAKHLSMILTSADSLRRLIDHILDYARIEADTLDLDTEPFDLGDLLDRCRTAFSEKARRKGLDLRFRREDDLPGDFLGDAERIGQILSNLIENALTFTEQGGVTVVIRLMNARETSAQLAVSVADTGIGISEDRLEDLFESFKQLDGSYSRKYPGTGLGLAISKRLVEMMGGKIWVESEVGRGSTFHFSLVLDRPPGPRAPAGPDALTDPGRAEPEAGRAGPPSPRRYRILVAEDNPLNQEFLSYFLKKGGHEVTTVDDGASALAALEAERFDLVLMDIHMPGMDGVEATRRIRDGIGGGKVDPDIPIIALTAYAMKGDRDRFLDAGMDEYVAKPVDIDAVQAVMDRMVHGSGGSVGGPPRRDRFKEIDGLFETFKEDERILGRMVRGFLAEAPPLLRDLRAGYEAGDLGAAADAAHAMANLAVAVRALGLVNLSRDFECAARGGEVEEGRRLYGELLVEVEAVTSHVAALPLPEAAGEEHHEG